MLRQMAREADDFARQRRYLLDAAAVRIEPGARKIGAAVAAGAPDGRRQRADRVFRQSERLADLADGGAAAIRDHGGGDAGALAAIFLVDILDDLLAPLVLEIDVDVRRFAPFRRNEALEQKIGAIGIDLGDAEAEAYRRIGGRAAALAQDLLRAGVANDVMHGEKIRRVAQLRDQRQFVLNR